MATGMQLTNTKETTILNTIISNKISIIELKSIKVNARKYLCL